MNGSRFTSIFTLSLVLLFSSSAYSKVDEAIKKSPASDIINKLDDIEDEVLDLHSDLDECCQEISSILDRVSVACDFIITAEQIFDGAPILTLSVPGVYCLSENVSNVNPSSPVIEITAENVVLDLHGHTITSSSAGTIVKVTSTAGVVVKNGTLRNAGIGVDVDDSLKVIIQDLMICDSTGTASTDAGLVIRGSDNVVVENTQALIGAANGFRVDDSSTSCVFKHCISNQNVLAGFNLVVFSGGAITGPEDCCLFDCKAAANGNRGFLIGGDNHVIENCIANENFLEGFDIIASSCTFKNCKAIKNQEHGFDIDQITELTAFTGATREDLICNVLEDCVALENGSGQNGRNGFKIQGSKHTIKGCIANCNSNGAGFEFANDVPTGANSTSSDHVVCDCIADGNAGDGFLAASDSAQIKFMSNKAQNNGDDGFDNDGTNNRFFNNCSCNNGGLNYNGSFIRAIVLSDDSTGSIDFWNNMDCGLAG